VGYPGRVLWEDEEVLAHQHPHWSTTARPVVLLLVVVGAGSFGAAAVPVGGDQGVLRLAVVGVAAVVLLLGVARPLARWVTTSYVVTSDRLLVRRGLSARRAAEVDLASVEAVTHRRSAGQRLLRSGTVLVRCGDRSAPLVLLHVPRCDRFSALLDDLVGEVLGGDADPAGRFVTGPVTGAPGSRVG
jgi:membrane protein YdbS with pleckstrin-like domain